jgi:inner membrane protein
MAGFLYGPTARNLVYQQGHHGVSLLLFAPVAHQLLTAGEPLLAIVTGGVFVGLAMLPDVDHQLPGIPHRGPTHSLLFAGLVGAAFAAIWSFLGSAFGLSGGLGLSTVEYGFALGAGAVLAHLVGDTLTPMGVNYLWPVDRELSLSLVTADNTAANYGLLGGGVVAVAAAVYLAAPA